MKRMNNRTSWIVLLLAMALCTPGAWAQATTGSILGLVMDQTGAVVVGAHVTATNSQSGLAYDGETNATGEYHVLYIVPGDYVVSAVAPGFQKTQLPPVTLVIDQKLVLNMKLQPGAASETVVVNDLPPVLQTQSAETGTVIGAQDISDLPLLGRDFYNLTLLVPGVQQTYSNMSAFSVSVNGQREFGNSVQIDGIESTDNRQQDVTITPSVDAIEEFKVATSTYNAEFGHAAGGVVSIQTKSGTNQFHGTAYEFFRANFTTARQYSFGGTSESPTLKQHNYGGSIGGPLRKDKAMFFFSYEGMKNNDAYTYLGGTVPLNLIDFKPDGSVDLSAMVDPSTGTPNPIFDPDVAASCWGWCASEFENYTIPADRVSPAGKNLLQNFFPMPNLTGTSYGYYKNFAVNSPKRSNTKTADSRFDLTLGANDKFFAAYHYSDNDQFVADPYWGAIPVVGGGDYDQAQHMNGGSQGVSITETHAIGSSKMNEFRAGYIRMVQNQYSLLNGTDYSTQFGMGNIAVPDYAATIGYPAIFMGTGYITGGSTWKPYLVKQNNYEVNDNFTMSQFHGHDIKFGGNWRKLNSYPNFSLFPTGFMYFQSWGWSLTSDSSYATNTGGGFWAGGSDIADMLLGLPTTVGMGLQLTNPHTQSWEFSSYAQDTYRINPRLTLNYGIRFEYQNPYTEAHDYQSNYDYDSGMILVANRGGNSRGLINARKNDIAPRFGFSYLVTPKMVVRGGYGIYYSPENDGREEFLTKNVPFASQVQYANSDYSGLPWNYVLDTGVPRSTEIVQPSSGSGIIDPLNLPDGKLRTTYYIDPKIKTGSVQMYNLTLEQQLSKTMSLEAGYVASIGHALSYQIGDINGNTDGTEGRVNPNLGKIQQMGSFGYSNYNSLQVKFTKRSSRNLSYLISYTWAHGLDNGPGPFSIGRTNNNQPQNPYNLHAEYASSDSDLRHNFIYSGTYRLPIGKGQSFFSHWNNAAEMILGGWRLNGIYMMRSGTPVNVVRGTSQLQFPGLRPDLVGDPVLPRGKRTLGHWFNTDAFSVDRFQTQDTEFAVGNAGRNLFAGPGYINIDSSIFKELNLHDRYTLQLRLESFNTLNTPHFSNPDGVVNDGDAFGGIQYTDGNPRRVQLAAKIIF